MKTLFTIILILGIGLKTEAQIGNSVIGISRVGLDSLNRNDSIGYAYTPMCERPGSCEGACIRYTFIGSGNWDIAGNWDAGIIPPAVLQNCAEILIDPTGNECLLNIPLQIIPEGSSLKVAAGKTFRLPGNLVIGTQ